MSTLRTRPLLILGKLARCLGNLSLFKLPANVLLQRTWDYALKQIETLKP